MKRFYVFMIVLFACSVAAGQHHFIVQDQQLYNPCRTCPCLEDIPPPGDFTSLAPITKKQVADIYKLLIDTLKVEFNYPQGNCHDRAHIIYLVLKKKGIESLKIWNFAPNRIGAVFNESLSIPDQNNFDPDGLIKWGYHVAPVVLVKENNKTDTVVVDPSIFKTAADTYQKWLAAQNCTNSFYTFLSAKWYLFYSLKGFTAYDLKDRDHDKVTYQPITLPKWFPNLLTGHFYQYCDFSKPGNRLAKGLAENEMAMSFYYSELKPLMDAKNPDTTTIRDYKKLMGSILNLADVFTENKSNHEIEADFLMKHHAVIKKYKDILAKNAEKWVKTIQPYLE